jgi:uncharacterized protein (TIRG00374 family)
MDERDTTLTATRELKAKPALGWIKPAFSYLLAVACLVWVFHDIHVGRLLRSMTTIHWWWVALAIVFDILTYICQGARWRLLLRPVGDVTVLRATQAIYVGLFTNEILPMRFGEFVRAYLASRWVSIEFSSVIPSMIVERLLDGVWLALAVGLTAILVPLPKDLLEAGDVFGIIVLVSTALFIYAVFRKERRIAERATPSSFGWKPLRLAGVFVGRLASGLRSIGLSRLFYGALAVSILMLGLQALSFWLIMWAYGLRLSFWIGAVVFLVVHLGTALPNAPANVGTYQFFCVVGLALFGVDKTLATGFSLVVFFLLTVPLWVLGFLALARSGMTLSTIRDEIKRLKIGEEWGR